MLLARGEAVDQAATRVGVTAQTYYRWRKEYGGMRPDQAGGSSNLRRRIPA